MSEWLEDFSESESASRYCYTCGTRVLSDGRCRRCDYGDIEPEPLDPARKARIAGQFAIFRALKVEQAEKWEAVKAKAIAAGTYGKGYLGKRGAQKI